MISQHSLQIAADRSDSMNRAQTTLTSLLCAHPGCGYRCRTFLPSSAHEAGSVPPQPIRSSTPRPPFLLSTTSLHFTLPVHPRSHKPWRFPLPLLPIFAGQIPSSPPSPHSSLGRSFSTPLSDSTLSTSRLTPHRPHRLHDHVHQRSDRTCYPLVHGSGRRCSCWTDDHPLGQRRYRHSRWCKGTHSSSFSHGAISPTSR